LQYARDFHYACLVGGLRRQMYGRPNLLERKLGEPPWGLQPI
jgi:hypothetical protein